MKFLSQKLYSLNEINSRAKKTLCKSNVDFNRHNIYAFYYKGNNGIFILKRVPPQMHAPNENFVWEGLNGTETYFHKKFASFADAIDYAADKKQIVYKFTDQSDFIIWAASIVAGYSVKK